MAAQGLRLCTYTAGGAGSIPGLGSSSLLHSEAKKKKKKDYGKVRHSEGVTEFPGGLTFQNEAFQSRNLMKLNYSC